MPGDEDLEITPLGRRILLAAKEAGFTQTSLERAGEWTKGRLSRLVHRPQTQIELGTIRLLRDLLGVRTDWLLFGEGPMREGGAPSAFSEAMILAAAQGIPHSTILAVHREHREEAERDAWSPRRWYERIGEANRRAVIEGGEAKAKRHVEMWHEKRASKKRAAVAQEKDRLAEATQAADNAHKTGKRTA